MVEEKNSLSEDLERMYPLFLSLCFTTGFVALLFSFVLVEYQVVLLTVGVGLVLVEGVVGNLYNFAGFEYEL